MLGSQRQAVSSFMGRPTTSLPSKFIELRIRNLQIYSWKQTIWYTHTQFFLILTN